MTFKKFVETGRVAYGVKGPAEGKLFVIVDIIDYNRVLVDGPCTNVPRQEYRLNNLSLTKYKIGIQHGQHTKHVRNAWEEEKITEKWGNSEWAKKLQLKEKKKSLDDFDRFKVAYLKKAQNRVVEKVIKLSIQRKRAVRRRRAVKDEKQKSLKAKSLGAKRPGAKVSKLYAKLRTKGVFKATEAKKTVDKKVVLDDAKKAKLAELKKKRALARKAKVEAARTAGKVKAVKSKAEKLTATKKPAPAKPKKATAPASKKAAAPASKKATAPAPKKAAAPASKKAAAPVSKKPAAASKKPAPPKPKKADTKSKAK